MVDASSNIKDKVNFQLMMRFIRSVFHSFTLGRGVRYGLLVYGSSVKVLIYLFIYLFIFLLDTSVTQYWARFKYTHIIFSCLNTCNTCMGFIMILLFSRSWLLRRPVRGLPFLVTALSSKVTRKVISPVSPYSCSL